MQIFNKLKNYLSYLGFGEFDRPHATTIRIVLNCFIIIISSYSVVITIAFLIIERDAAFNVKVQCTGAMFSVVYCAVVAIIFTRQKKLFFDIVHDTEEIIANRERKYASVVSAVYNEANANFEVFTVRMIFFMNVFIYTFSFSIIMCVSYYYYYAKDMGEEAFIASVPSK